MRWLLPIFLAALLLGSGGCLFTGEESFACSQDDPDCPEGQSCDQSTGRCVPAGTADGGSDGGGADGGCTPRTADCNGADDDCDGATDEADELTGAAACPLQAGVCAGSVERCVGGSWESCDAAAYGGDYEATETRCDGLDNDCDGSSDPGCPECQGNETQVCGVAEGVCSLGAQQCSGGVWGPCSGVEPGSETCDGLDNDCDGQTDEDIPPAPCRLTEGVCAGSQIGCIDGATQVCDADTYGPDFELTETLCDGLDNNCDGNTDADGTGAPLVAACAKQLGVCAGAMTTCGGAQGFLPCGDVDYGQHAAASGATYHPTLDLTCDGVDDDCDGETDEDYVGDATGCLGGGVDGVCAGLVNVCADGFVSCATPGSYEATEVSCDDLDNDCDGAIDDADPDLSCSCFEPNTQPCSTDVGECEAGTQDCVGGTWGSCSGVLPATDVCNGLDDDCDGQTDEDFPTKGNACSVGQGQCLANGTRVCAGDGLSTVCSATPGASGAETCNGLDDDCDGQTDEDFPDKGSTCSAGEGECLRSGSRICSPDGLSTECDAVPGAAEPEVCDGFDNDCDTAIDEDLDPTAAPDCGTQAGVCVGAKQACQGGGYAACTSVQYAAAATAIGAVYEQTESLCDGRDNDCDLSIDEADNLAAPPCTEQDGVCAGLYQTCSGGAWQDCSASDFSALPDHEADETSCDALDNDCDGDVDEGCNCVDGTTQSCGTDVGECTLGTQVCNNGTWSVCDGQVPSFERCDALDRDCNGEPTNGFPVGNSCTAGVGACVASGVYRCDAAGTGVVCDATPSSGEAELCDGIDNDCDGATDEDASGNPLTELCGPQPQQGVCDGATWVCSNGTYPTTCNFGASYQDPEVSCDQQDNDCDGEIDEGTDFSCPQGNLCQRGTCSATGCTLLPDPMATCGVGCTCQNGQLRESGCADRDDNDNDGLTDCFDPDCGSSAPCQIRCGDARCAAPIECNVCGECAKSTQCSTASCNDGYCDLFGGECGVCAECTNDPLCDNLSCAFGSCQPQNGMCAAGCSSCALFPGCRPGVCNDNDCNSLSNECATCSGLGEDCYAVLAPPPVCRAPDCSDGICAPEAGECGVCKQLGDDCLGHPFCAQLGCEDGICNVALGECIFCDAATEDCGNLAGPIPACTGATDSANACQNEQDGDGDGLVGCADPDCEGQTCGAGCVCNQGWCENSATRQICP